MAIRIEKTKYGAKCAPVDVVSAELGRVDAVDVGHLEEGGPDLRARVHGQILVLDRNTDARVERLVCFSFVQS